MEQAAKVAKEQLRWAKGHKVTLQDWMNLCRYSADARFQNLAYGLEYGLDTGRLPNWTRRGYDRYFTQDSQLLSNVQVRNRLAQAADAQQELTTAAAVRALQVAFGQRVR